MNDEKNLHEILRGYFPNLNKKESIICREIAWCVFDNDIADEGSVISHSLEKKDIFCDEADVERTIKRLCEKGIVKAENFFISTSRFDNLIRRFDILLTLSGNVEEEIVYCWRKEFEYAVKGTFSVHKTGSQQPG